MPQDYFVFTSKKADDSVFCNLYAVNGVSPDAHKANLASLLVNRIETEIREVKKTGDDGKPKFDTIIRVRFRDLERAAYLCGIGCPRPPDQDSLFDMFDLNP